MDDYEVLFIGGPMGYVTQSLPIRDLSESPFMCSGSVPPYLHWNQEGPPEQRAYMYVGPCAEIYPLNHVHP